MVPDRCTALRNYSNLWSDGIAFMGNDGPECVHMGLPEPGACPSSLSGYGQVVSWWQKSWCLTNANNTRAVPEQDDVHSPTSSNRAIFRTRAVGLAGWKSSMRATPAFFPPLTSPRNISVSRAFVSSSSRPCESIPVSHEWNLPLPFLAPLLHLLITHCSIQTVPNYPVMLSFPLVLQRPHLLYFSTHPLHPFLSVLIPHQLTWFTNVNHLPSSASSATKTQFNLHELIFSAFLLDKPLPQIYPLNFEYSPSFSFILFQYH